MNSAAPEESGTPDCHAAVGEALLLLRDGLGPFVERQEVGKSTPERFESFRSRPQQSGNIGEWDVAALLGIMQHLWMDVFRQVLSRTERAYVTELQDVRNNWAHQEPFSTDDADRALDSITRLLRAVKADSEANKVAKLRKRLQVISDVGRAHVGTTGMTRPSLQGNAAIVKQIRAESRQSWKNMQKAVRALMGLPHEPFGTPNVAASSKSTVRKMLRETGLSQKDLKEMLDAM